MRQTLTLLLSVLLTAFISLPSRADADRETRMPESASSVLSLDGSDWTLSFWKQPETAVRCPEGIPSDAESIPATVPGNVDIDLMAAGLEADPRIGNNNALTRQWEDCQWCYTKSYNVSDYKSWMLKADIYDMSIE